MIAPHNAEIVPLKMTQYKKKITQGAGFGSWFFL